MLTLVRLKLLCRARDELREVGPQERSIADVARRAAMSRYHFSRQYKALFGESPSQCRRIARLNLARQLLAREQYSVTDACMAVGFSSLGSFSTSFARRFGQSPAAFAKTVAGTSINAGPGCLCLLRQSWQAR